MSPCHDHTTTHSYKISRNFWHTTDAPQKQNTRQLRNQLFIPSIWQCNSSQLHFGNLTWDRLYFEGPFLFLKRPSGCLGRLYFTYLFYQFRNRLRSLEQLVLSIAFAGFEFLIEFKNFSYREVNSFKMMLAVEKGSEISVPHTRRSLVIIGCKVMRSSKFLKSLSFF